MKRCLKRGAALVAVLLVLTILFALFVYCEGIQYSLAYVSDTIVEPQDLVTAAQSNERTLPTQIYTVMTFNVLCRACKKEGYDDWPVRAPQIQALIHRYAPDLLGLQELGGKADITDVLGEEHPYTGVYYRLGSLVYADCGLFYRKDRFEAVEEGRFWLSPKPHLPFAFAWNVLSVPRYVNWVLLRDRESDARFIFANTHFDNNSPNKQNSARLCGDLFSQVAKEIPVIFTGDFNTRVQTERYPYLIGAIDVQGNAQTPPALVNARDIAQQVRCEESASAVQETFIEDGDLIDHILLGGTLQAKVHEWVLDNSSYGPDQRRISDHPAIVAEIGFESVAQP